MSYFAHCFESLESRQLLTHLPGINVLADSFSGTRINSALWQMPHWTPDGSTYLGRTQLRVDQNAPPPRVSSGRVLMPVDSYNPTGFSFYGSQLASRNSYKIGSGLDVVFQAKMNSATPGVVGGLFLYGPLGAGRDGALIRNEIDVAELVSSQPGKINTNVFVSQGFSAAGQASFITLPQGGGWTDYHIYEAKVFTNAVFFYVDKRLVRQVAVDFSPRSRFQLMFNIWVPDASWPEAYSAGLQPTHDVGADQRFTMNVAYVALNALTPASRPPVINPSIQISGGAPRGAYGSVWGKVTALPGDYSGVATYIYTQGGWWTKPYWDSPLTSIDESGNWSTYFTTGGAGDIQATEIRAYLIPKGFDVPLARGGTLPAGLAPLLYASLKR